MSGNRCLVLDGYNLIHRARGGFQKGDWPVVFNFFRGLRPFVERYNPDVVKVVLEGTPKRNLELLPEYKANRGPAPDDFVRQKDAIIDVLGSMPVDIVYHPDFEADDVVHNVIKAFPRVFVTVVSSDSDFTQLLQTHKNVRVYNWREKLDLVAPDYDYVKWKALRGDPTDNIPRCHKMTDRTAIEVAKDDNRLALLLQDAAFQNAYKRNLELVRLQDFTEHDVAGLVTIPGRSDWDRVRELFNGFGFKSMTGDKSWVKYVRTFQKLEKKDKNDDEGE